MSKTRHLILFEYTYNKYFNCIKSYTYYNSANLFLGQSMLCYYQSVLYEATCVNRRLLEDSDREYYIHYMGWKNRWDEWVDNDRLLQPTLINMFHMSRTHTRANE